MKKILFSLFTLFAVCMRTTAQTISVEDVETLLGNTAVSIALRVQGAENMTSMHIEITDPSGLFAIHSASATPEWAALFSTGSAGMSAISTSDNSFSGDGIVASVELSMPADIVVGTYPISISNARINGADIAETTFNVIVTNCVTLDENSTTAPQASTEPVDVRVIRTINANEWSTICLPFAMSEEQVKAAFGEDVQLGDFDGTDPEYDGDNVVSITVNFINANAIEANHPYIIKVSQPVSEFTTDGVDITPSEKLSVDKDEQKFKVGNTWFTFYNRFVGTYLADTEVPENCLFLSNNQFRYSAGLTKMKAFRAYFDFLDILTDVENASNIKLWVNNDEETGIRSLTPALSQGGGATYNLSGQCVGKNYKGIVVEKGKKVLY